MAGEPLKFPKGAIAMGNGDLIDVTNVKMDDDNGAKLVHTIRRSGAGIAMGNRETTVTFDAVVSENGPERDYMDLIKTGKVKQLRIKIPGATYNVQGTAKSRALEIPSDGEIKYSVTFIGVLSE